MGADPLKEGNGGELDKCSLAIVLGDVNLVVAVRDLADVNEEAQA